MQYCCETAAVTSRRIGNLESMTSVVLKGWPGSAIPLNIFWTAAGSKLACLTSRNLCASSRPVIARRLIDVFSSGAIFTDGLALLHARQSQMLNKANTGAVGQ